MISRGMMVAAMWLLVAGCEGPEPAAQPSPDRPLSDSRLPGQNLPDGPWRMVMSLPGGPAPVRMDLNLSAAPSAAVFINGSERVSADRVVVEDQQVIMEFSAFNNRLRLAPDGDGLAGTLSLVKRGYTQEIPVTMRPGEDHRFSTHPEAEVNITGRWAVTFTDEEGKESEAVGEFDQEGSRVTGTFLTPLGDYRFLAGEVDGDTLKLSTFDGAHAFLFTAEAGADGVLQGDFWSGEQWHESWRAVRDFDAALPDPYEATRLSGDQAVDFTFPDLSGEPVSLSDPRFRGKVVLITLAGTWCPNCADEAKFLAPYYQANRERGLEAVGLLFEHFGDFETAAERGRVWKATHGIEFPLLVAGTSDKRQASGTLPFLDRVRAFPTMIFIDRAGQVRKIHTGFNGPGTGEHFEQFRRSFTAMVDELLAEPVPESVSTADEKTEADTQAGR